MDGPLHPSWRTTAGPCFFCSATYHFAQLEVTLASFCRSLSFCWQEPQKNSAYRFQLRHKKERLLGNSIWSLNTDQLLPDCWHWSSWFRLSSLLWSSWCFLGLPSTYGKKQESDQQGSTLSDSLKEVHNETSANQLGTKCNQIKYKASHPCTLVNLFIRARHLNIFLGHPVSQSHAVPPQPHKHTLSLIHSGVCGQWKPFKWEWAENDSSLMR